MDLEVLEKEALRLPASERAAIAGRILDSLEGLTQTGIQDHTLAWNKEISQREAALNAGAMPTVAWETVRQRLFTA